jgi:VRR-NUC domain
MKRIEQQHQIALVKWFGIQYEIFKKFLIHIPNEGKRSKFQGYILNSMGMRAGIPDLFLAIPRGSSHGYFIEMKSPGKKPTDSQTATIIRLRSMGYQSEWFDDWMKAARSIESYLEY